MQRPRALEERKIMRRQEGLQHDLLAIRHQPRATSCERCQQYPPTIEQWLVTVSVLNLRNSPITSSLAEPATEGLDDGEGTQANNCEEHSSRA